ncbi:hypothetical protein [Curtobacterium flaccumfaciens]|uniref:hypothetical protein n=1 Tax=Curtobacterium flaccumfaciens TaxID=2035 RepID=UPI001BDEDB39|nr:hypothetical protein [Curtobacterium flaccumfaciens]MBT1633248.1 hypothetical protein [Curtobacterium flaccumfaciens pv. oortii]MCX2846896.1 hypothetical protein [Curtobacterium flaccumfaciens pv. oortii]
MTALTHRVDAAAVPLTDFDALEVGTTVAWNGWTAQHGTLFSPLERETAPDVVALVDGPQVDVLHLTDAGRYRRTATLQEGSATLAQVLDQVDALVPAEPVLRFATGRELDARGLRDVPAVALWTGPDVPAWQVALTGRRLDLRGFRVSWQDTLSHRVTDNASGDAASARLTAVQDVDDTWTLTDARGVISELEDPVEHHTLAQVLAWMNAEVHTLLERTPFEQLGARPFAVTDRTGCGPLTVEMW